MRRFTPEGTFLDSRVRGNDEGGDGSGEGSGEPDFRLSRK
jgi:hypothetical protein